MGLAITSILLQTLEDMEVRSPLSSPGNSPELPTPHLQCDHPTG
ncbi:hypothetical protein [aff. Roholtiella sp. LEGE 12411]|nr:hypothetical protein [aff. Roholtiella sp. LEGE 12411]